MRRAELEHVIRAAAEVAGTDEIVVVGSQAILAQFPDAPASLLVSQEADVYPREAPELAELIDGALGDGSPFHESFGYYAHGVGPETTKAPTGWEERLVPVRVDRLPSGGEVIGWCLDVHDLVLAKAAAGRERDWEYVTEAIRHQLVSTDALLSRVTDLPVSRAQHETIRKMLDGIGARVARAPDR